MEKILRAWLRDTNVSEETSDPCSEDPKQHQDQQRCSDVIHDSLEVALVLCALNKIRGAANKRVLGRCDHDGVSSTTLASRGVVDELAQVLVDC